MFAKRTNWNLATNRLSAALAAHRAAGKPLIDLTISNPTECGFHYNEAAILAALQNRAALKYEPNPRGLAVAREAVARYYLERGGALSHVASQGAEHAAGPTISGDDIFLTTSTSEAYSYAFRALCDPDDEILIPEPSYPLFEFLADIQDVRLVRYPLIYDHGWQIDFHGLEQAMTPRTRGVIVVHPNNPTGHFCKPDEMRKLHEICAPRGVAIIADEVFLDFSLKERRAETPASHGFTVGDNPSSFTSNPAAFPVNAKPNSAALTFTLSGISKICGLPQMKAAWLAVSGPGALTNEAVARIEVIADTYLSMNAPIQWALPTFLEQRHDFQRELMARVRENLQRLDDALASQKACTRLEVEGGWNAVLRVPATRSDEDLALDLLADQGVYVHPGHFYDFPAEGYLVVSLITPTEQFKKGTRKLLSAF